MFIYFPYEVTYCGLLSVCYVCYAMLCYVMYVMLCYVCYVMYRHKECIVTSRQSDMNKKRDLYIKYHDM